jgi:hypothetical protein
MRHPTRPITTKLALQSPHKSSSHTQLQLHCPREPHDTEPGSGPAHSPPLMGSRIIGLVNCLGRNEMIMWSYHGVVLHSL